MPYKDSEQRKEAARKSMRRRREGLTLEGLTGPQDPGVNNWGKPKILSDGQLWWPGHQGLHPPGCECGIKHIEKPLVKGA